MIKVSIAENLEEVEKRISAAAKRSGRKREDITLVAVTKTHPAEMMNEAIKLGVTDIGENKPRFDCKVASYRSFTDKQG